jgi:two-component system, NtrC family, sensor kinase
LTAKKTTVLIVDDRVANRYTTSHALTRAGFEVIEAATGMEALEISKQLPTVIILDVKLPDILGYEVCRRIKSNLQTRHIPVLQLSAAFLSNESKLYALESGADAYLIQPADPVVLVATVKSLVRLQRAESQARLAAKQWQATFDALNEGVAILDSSNIVQRCNRAMTNLLDRSYSEIEGRTLVELTRECFDFDPSRSGEGFPIEVQSKKRFFRLSEAPIYSQGESTGCIFIVAETTQRKLAEQAILSSERLAATGRIAHTIAHEINNPLEAITNLVYLLQSSLDKPEIAREYLDTATTELARVSRISRQILSFNRESAVPVRIDLGALIDDVLALNNRAVVDKGLKIWKDWKDAFEIRGFPAQLRQVFSNLLRNATEASFLDGQILIRISSSRLGCDPIRPAIRVTIADQGVGISHSNLEKIFDAFFTTKELKGSGVGLWLSSSIVREHGGRMQVRSSTKFSRSGTCMSVLLPCNSSDGLVQLRGHGQMTSINPTSFPSTSGGVTG